MVIAATAVFLSVFPAPVVLVILLMVEHALLDTHAADTGGGGDLSTEGRV